MSQDNHYPVINNQTRQQQRQQKKQKKNKKRRCLMVWLTFNTFLIEIFFYFNERLPRHPLNK